MLSVAGPGSSGSVGSDRSCGFVLTGCGFGWLGGDGFIAGRRRCGRTIAALLQATARDGRRKLRTARSEEHTSELQSLMRNSYAVFCLKKKKKITTRNNNKSDNTIIKTSTQQATC